MLSRILLLILVLLVLPAAYVYFRYVRRWTRRPWLRLLAFLPSLLLLLYFLLVLRHDDMYAGHQARVSIFMFVFLLLSVPPMLFAIIDGIGSLLPWRGAVRRAVRIAALAVAGCAAGIILYGYAEGRRHYVVHEQAIAFHNLPPAFDGYRIALFSDLHIGTFADGHRKDVADIVKILNAQQCNAILFAGDLVNFQTAELDGYDTILAQLRAPDGVYSIMGNHDYAMYIHDPGFSPAADIAALQARQRKLGWRLLLNQNHVIHRDTDSIAIIGVENDGRPPFPSLGDLPKATAGLTGLLRTDPDSLQARRPFAILMSHDPTHWHRRVIPDTRIDLTLSGHTHACQLKILGWSPAQWIYDEWSGLYSDNGQQLDVSEGVGQVMFGFRFGAWPEINVITLKIGDKGVKEKVVK